MPAKTDKEAWRAVGDDDLWVFDKFIVARMSGHRCGSRGMPVPKTGWYCVRPVTNLEGMGHMARREWLEAGVAPMHLHPGEFWCEWFEGEHLSVDYRAKRPILAVRATRGASLHGEMWRFERWDRVGTAVPWPRVLNRLAGMYDTVNCEFIGGRLVEAHLRPNSDFAYGNDYMIPVWRDGPKVEPQWHEKFIPDTDPHDLSIRLGRIVGRR